jgi:hypothetical protein
MAGYITLFLDRAVHAAYAVRNSAEGGGARPRQAVCAAKPERVGDIISPVGSPLTPSTPPVSSITMAEILSLAAVTNFFDKLSMKMSTHQRQSGLYAKVISKEGKMSLVFGGMLQRMVYATAVTESFSVVEAGVSSRLRTHHSIPSFFKDIISTTCGSVVSSIGTYGFFLMSRAAQDDPKGARPSLTMLYGGQFLSPYQRSYVMSRFTLPLGGHFISGNLIVDLATVPLGNLVGSMVFSATGSTEAGHAGRVVGMTALSIGVTHFVRGASHGKETIWAALKRVPAGGWAGCGRELIYNTLMTLTLRKPWESQASCSEK